MITVSHLFEQQPQLQQLVKSMQAVQKSENQLAANLQQVDAKMGLIEKLFGSVPQGHIGTASQLHPIGSAAQKINQAIIRQFQQR